LENGDAKIGCLSIFVLIMLVIFVLVIAGETCDSHRAKTSHYQKKTKKRENKPAVASGPVREFTKKDTLFYVTGCENGELMVPLVNVWLLPGGISPGNRVIGKVSGAGRGKNKCKGSIVRKLTERNVNGRTWIRIDTVVGDYKAGWFTDSFVGKGYKRKNCKKDFKGYPVALKRCLGK